MAEIAVGLTDAIGALRQELAAVLEESADEQLRFKLAPIELTLQVAVTKEAEGKIGWKVLGLGGSYTSATTQTLKLRLEPVWQNEDGSLVSDFTVADQASQAPRFGSTG